MSVKLTSDGKLEEVIANLESTPSWLPKLIEPGMRALGKQVEGRMRVAIEDNRYTGALEESITSEYDAAQMAVSIFPTAKRGEYDGGVLLETGTGPIPNAPWAPIAAWAEFKGLPAFPVVYKIRTVGVSEHPFLQRTLDSAEPDMVLTAGWIVGSAGAKIMGLPMEEP